jgi:hypothetical protein
MIGDLNIGSVMGNDKRRHPEAVAMVSLYGGRGGFRDAQIIDADTAIACAGLLMEFAGRINEVSVSRVQLAKLLDYLENTEHTDYVREFFPEGHIYETIQHLRASLEA